MTGSRSSERCLEAATGKRVVASSPILTVEACTCGVVHLHFGPMSLRFAACSLDMLYQTRGEARAALAGDDERASVLHVRDGAPHGLA